MSVVPITTARDAERTALDWRSILLARLDAQAQEAEVYGAYYDGEHPMQFATSKYREAFGALFGAFADNWCQIVVDASVERLKVVGFRVDEKDSPDAWEIWQRNQLDVESVIAHTEAGKCGRAYLLVDPNEGKPLITVEHPGQVIVAHDPAEHRKRLAAIKLWLGDDLYQYLTLYLPDVIYKFESEDPVRPGGQLGPTKWVQRQGEPFEVENTLAVVPMIPLENKPGLLSTPHSDLEPAVPLQNAINKLCSDLIVTSEYGAFPQRVVTGVEVPKDPETGQPLASAELRAAMSRLWTFKPADAKVTSLAPADLSNFVNAVEMFVTHLAAQTRTPPHYLLAKLVNMSGDALSVAEAGLVSKCRTKTLFFSDSWEEAMALALTAAGSETSVEDTEAIWQPVERVTPVQAAAAAVQKKAVGVPLEMIWQELGYTPQQIEEMKKIAEAAETAKLEAAAQAEAAAAREMLQQSPSEAEPTAAPAVAPGTAPGVKPGPPQTPPAPPASPGGTNA